MLIRVALVGVIAVIFLLGIEQVLPEPRLCPYRVHDWTVAGPGGEYGVTELGYVTDSRYPSFAHARVLLGPLGACSLLKLVVRFVVFLLASLSLCWWMHVEPIDGAGRSRNCASPREQ
jgi:hypothetical protein